MSTVAFPFLETGPKAHLLYLKLKGKPAIKMAMCVRIIHGTRTVHQ